VQNLAGRLTQIALATLSLDLAVEAQAAWIEFPAAGPLHTVTTLLTLPLVALAATGLAVTLLARQHWVRHVPRWAWGLSGALGALVLLALMVLFIVGAGS